MRKTISNTIFPLMLCMFMLFIPKGGHAEMTAQTVSFPQTVGLWTGSDAAQIVDSSNIFDYMNGAGELYLAYRFNHLEVYEYTSEAHDDILVEIYMMETADDAFGLLSLDWEGEPVTFDSTPAESKVALPQRALYGGGLLRMCAGKVYARIMAYRETPESRKAVLTFGEMIAKNREMPAEPDVLQMLPHKIGTDWTIRQDRIGFFRSYLVLNSLYYLSHQNILNLDHSTEAVFAPYQKTINADETQRIQVLFVRYASSQDAQTALELFRTEYLEEQQIERDEGSHALQIEDGWVGYRRNGECLTIAFEAPDQETARMFTEQISCKK